MLPMSSATMDTPVAMNSSARNTSGGVVGTMSPEPVVVTVVNTQYRAARYCDAAAA